MSSAAPRIRYVCSGCGETSPKWEGRCAGCGAWNSLVEESARSAGSRRRDARVAPRQPILLEGVQSDGAARRTSGSGEIDRVLGGGIVAGALILLGGDPGIGKSTLALQLARSAGSGGAPALYCSGEESAAQVADRARRLGCPRDAVAVLSEIDLDVVLATIAAQRPPLAVVDSVQTLVDAAVAGAPGSPSQVRESVGRLMSCSKGTGVPIVLIGHVTKDGAIAGPRTLEHMVDVVLYVEGDRHGEHRIMRGIKNRFGPSGELGLFTMTQKGMEEVAAPGRAFLDETSLGVPGNVLTITCEGSRPLVVELQALAAPTAFGLPRRTASGVEPARLHLLTAVLERRARIHLGQSDVYINAVGGVRLADPGIDLAMVLALVGSVRDRTLPSGWAAVGEVGLGGEVRRIRRLSARLGEAVALGLECAIVPAGAADRLPPGLRCIRVNRIQEAVELLV